MLGIFDSGFGGLTVLKPIHARLPELSTIYLGDNARAPYGVRTQEEIYQYTLEGVRFLFEQGCPLVLLACNTASSQALRRIQREVLTTDFPDKRLLGVIRPAAEHLAKTSKDVGIFATPATVESGAYVEEVSRFNSSLQVTQISCPGLTDLIEAGLNEGENCSRLVEHFSKELIELNPSIQQVLLGCTHYPLIHNLFQKHLPEKIKVLDQGEIVATSLADYLDRHPEIMKHLDQAGSRKYFTSGDTNSKLGSQFYGEEIGEWKQWS